MKEPYCSILLIDDDISWQKINKIVLGKYGFHIHTAITKEEALKKVNESKYEIAVIDLRLVDDDETNFDGIQIIKELRNINPDTRILVKSGYLSPVAENELIVLGISKENVFDKGTTNKELVQRINKIYEEICQKREGTLYD